MCYVLPSDEVRISRIRDVLIAPMYDIAVFAAGGVQHTISLRVSKAPVPTNVDVLTYEFSGTSIERRDGKRRVHFSPFTHKGNVLRHYLSDFPEATPTGVFDTSFPALWGASGAPVVRATDFAVVEMLVANRERHLMPAQIVSIHDGAGALEETKYFLPTGKALEGHLLVEYLSLINAEVVVVT